MTMRAILMLVTGLFLAGCVANPAYRGPVYGGVYGYAPAYRAPAYRAPVYRAPVYRAPVYRAPVRRGYTHRAPVYRAPRYHAPRAYYGGPPRRDFRGQAVAPRRDWRAGREYRGDRGRVERRRGR